MHTHRIISVKRLITKRDRVHTDDSKSHGNARSEKLFRCGKWLCAKVPRFCAGNRHFAQGRQISSMAVYTKAELADMHLAYGAENCSGPAAQLVYAERYPMICFPVIIS